MTDAFEVQGDFSPAQTSDFSPAETFVDTAEPVAAEPALPNGFVKLGLATELLRAVEDLGYTQPTLVQEKVIPLALPTDDAAGKAYIDLMVSSQTGSGKTAAFLLPALMARFEALGARCRIEVHPLIDRDPRDALAHADGLPHEFGRPAQEQHLPPPALATPERPDWQRPA